jgi:hypothetical protein
MKRVTTYCINCLEIFLVVAFTNPHSVRAENDGKCLVQLNIAQKELIRYQQNSKRWATTWGITWTTATTSQLIVAASIHDPETRKDLWVGSASAALGLIPTWIIPPEATRDFEFTGDCEEELSQAESLVRRLSTDTEIYNGTTAQIGNIAGNLITGLILGAGFGHWGAAAISLGAGIPLGEVMIVTYPKFGDGLQKKANVTIVPSSSGPALAVSFEF